MSYCDGGVGQIVPLARYKSSYSERKIHGAASRYDIRKQVHIPAIILFSLNLYTNIDNIQSNLIGYNILCGYLQCCTSEYRSVIEQTMNMLIINQFSLQIESRLWKLIGALNTTDGPRPVQSVAYFMSNTEFRNPNNK